MFDAIDFITITCTTTISTTTMQQLPLIPDITDLGGVDTTIIPPVVGLVVSLPAHENQR